MVFFILIQVQFLQKPSSCNVPFLLCKSYQKLHFFICLKIFKLVDSDIHIIPKWYSFSACFMLKKKEDLTMTSNSNSKMHIEAAHFKFALIAPVIQGIFPDATKTAYYRRVTEN